MRMSAAIGADLFFVLVFVVTGRASHHTGESAAGIASTAWPFLAGLAAGHLATRSWRRPAALVPAGVGVWLATVAIGQALRVVSGQGTAFAFILVSAAFLGLFLLGWRAAASRLPALAATLAGRRLTGPARGRDTGASHDTGYLPVILCTRAGSPDVPPGPRLPPARCCALDRCVTTGVALSVYQSILETG